jgi:hypothetical protein
LQNAFLAVECIVIEFKETTILDPESFKRYPTVMGNQNEPPTRENEDHSNAEVEEGENEIVEEMIEETPEQNIEKVEIPNNAPDLKKKLRYKSFTECVTWGLTVIEIRELLRDAGKVAPSREKKPELIARVLSLSEELITEAIQNNDYITNLFPFFQSAAKISHVKEKHPLYRFPSALASLLPNNDANSSGQQKKRKRTSNGSEDNNRKKARIDPHAEPVIPEVHVTLPQGINLSKCKDPFLATGNAEILKIFYLHPNTESTQTKFNIDDLNNETERVCIRSYQHDKANKYSEVWPTQCHFHLNNNNIMIRNQDFCIEDLTKFVKTDKTNEFQMCHDSYDSKAFIFVIQKIGLNPIQEVSKVVKTRSYDQSFKFVVDSFEKKKSKKDIKDIEETLRIVSITDQVSQAKIKTPCRGKHCQHITVFDLDVYLSMNLQMPQWKCPVCFQPSHISDIFIDSYFQNIIDSLEKDGLSDEVADVSIHPDGQWEANIPEKKESDIMVPDDIIIIDD